MIAANAIIEAQQPASERASAGVINAAIRRAADALGNTLAVCRRSYVHPGVLNPRLAREVASRRRRRSERLSADETRALAVLVAAAQPIATQLERSLRAKSRHATVRGVPKRPASPRRSMRIAASAA